MMHGTMSSKFIDTIYTLYYIHTYHVDLIQRSQRLYHLTFIVKLKHVKTHSHCDPDKPIQRV